MGKPNRNYWLHRITGGENGKILSYPLLFDSNILSIGWSFISSSTIAEDIKKRGKIAISEAYAAKGEKWAKNANSLLNFVHRMHKDDIVVVPLGVYINIYRLVDDIIYTNDNLPLEYIQKSHVVRKDAGMVSSDGQFIDLGYYRKVSIVATDILRSEAETALYNKTKAFQTNLDITEVRDSVDQLISVHQGKLTYKHANIISDIEIKNYKNLDYLHLTGFKRLNLFVGANNAGKSNLLEAISLYAANFNPQRLKEILFERNEDLEYFEENRSFDEKERISVFASFFPQRSFDKMANGTSIQLNSSKGGIQLYLKTAIFRDDTTVRRLARLSQYEMVTHNQMVSNLRESVMIAQPIDGKCSAFQTQTKNFENVMQMIRFNNRSIEFQSNNTEDRFPCKHLNCKRLIHNNTEEIWAKICMTEKEDDVLDALRLVDKKVQKFNFIKINSHTYLPMVLIEEEDNKKPITEMGDGMTHILNIIATIVSCRDGVVLLDEVESGLHYSTQMKLWDTICQIAKKYNVQVFATTHSNDCIDAFARNGLNGDGSLIRIEKWGDSLHVQSYESQEQVLSMRSNDMEIR